MLARQEQKQTAQRSHEGDADADEDLDLLPEDFLASLAEREANDRRLMERRLVSEQIRNFEAIDRTPKSRRKTLLDNRQIKGFTVQVMGAESARKASGTCCIEIWDDQSQFVFEYLLQTQITDRDNI